MDPNNLVYPQLLHEVSKLTTRSSFLVNILNIKTVTFPSGIHSSFLVSSIIAHYLYPIIIVNILYLAFKRAFPLQFVHFLSLKFL